MNYSGQPPKLHQPRITVTLVLASIIAFCTTPILTACFSDEHHSCHSWSSSFFWVEANCGKVPWQLSSRSHRVVFQSYVMVHGCKSSLLQTTRCEDTANDLLERWWCCVSWIRLLTPSAKSTTNQRLPSQRDVKLALLWSFWSGSTSITSKLWLYADRDTMLLAGFHQTPSGSCFRDSDSPRRTF